MMVTDIDPILKLGAVNVAIEEYFEQILTNSTAINDAFDRAFFVMVHLPYLQPFQDEQSSLHEGNFARYQLRPAEFSDWEKLELVMDFNR